MTTTPDAQQQEEIGPEDLAWALDQRTVYERMVAIIDELPAIGKTQRNEQQKFMFRGHDDVMNALNPLLAKHGVFVVPDVLERVVGERVTGNNKTMYEVNLHVRYTFYGAGGDAFVATGWGEGTDMGDKATSKAMTMAFKYVIAQAFALATAETSDADATSPEETVRGGARQEAAQRPKQEFDPGRHLAPGAIAVKTEEDANSLRMAIVGLDPNQPWTDIEAFLIVSLFEKPYDDLSTAEKREFYTRYANALVRIDDISGGVDGFPPPTHDQIQEGFAWAFKGTMVALSEPETPFEDTAEAPVPPEAENG